MFKNRAAGMPLPEKAAYSLAALVIAAFVVIISAIFIKNSDSIVKNINLSNIYYINFFCALGLNSILMLSVIVEAFEEINAVFYRRETQFLLQFSDSGRHYYFYKLIAISFKIMPVLVLLFPFYLMHLFFFFYNFGIAALMFFLLFSLLSLPVILVFFAALSMGLCVLLARLLSLLNQRTLILLSVLFMAVFLSFYFPDFKNILTSKQTAGETAPERLFKSLSSAAVYFEFFPASFLAEALSALIKNDHKIFISNIAYSLLSAFMAVAAGFFITRRFLLKDLGCLMDGISARQGSDGSIKCFRPLTLAPPLWRAAIIDETAHLLRQNLTLIIIFMAPAIFAAPFYLPEKMIAAFISSPQSSGPSWIFFLINSLVIVQLTDLMAADINSKRSFLPLMRTFPVKIFDFIKIKVCFYFLLAAFILVAVCAPWKYFLGLGARESLEIFIITILWSAASAVICYGTALIAAALFSPKKDPDGLTISNPAIQILDFIFVTIFCLGLIKLKLAGFSNLSLIYYITAWLAVFSAALIKGSAMLDNKEL
jgi:hypothetical protein